MIYNNKIFRSVENSSSGEVSSQTLFHYWQEGDVIWVKLMGFDDRGKVRLGMKMVDQSTGKEIES